MKTRSTFTLLIITLFTFSCLKDDATADPLQQEEELLTTNLHIFFFGHSLISCLQQVNVMPSNKTTTPHK